MNNPFQNPIGNPNDPNNQLLLMSLAQVDSQNMFFFLMQNPDFVEKQDETQFKKTAIGFVRNTLGIFVLGTVLNLQMKRIPKFLNWPLYVKIPLRIPVFFSPFFIFQQSLTNQLDNLTQLHHKYYTRILRVKKTGDLRYFDPQGVLQKQFEQKMRELMK
ncbi:unnamed protein product [Paramecium primaurelia]|uniref:Uncharacterized protein n=2 Tax=Paramecium TaxID=5884 RepID=A0A8S1W195_9CILI|nr:unnamed protein product [Paramecium primaurelia]CAD8184118.1 unnamed protein product [Paramecium pentaurelia]